MPEYMLKDTGCPVTSVKFLESGGNEDGDFTYIEFTKDYKLGFSKVTDSLPVTDFQVQ